MHHVNSISLTDGARIGKKDTEANKGVSKLNYVYSCTYMICFM
jgi:hypothetical protein